jgi:hypothetical protein
MGLTGDEALVSSAALESLRDRIYLLEAALTDVESDLRGRPEAGEYKRAFQHLYAAAAQLRGAALEPAAVPWGDETSP